MQDDTEMTPDEFWQSILDRLDRIIELLTAPTTQVFQYHYGPPTPTVTPSVGWKCGVCGVFVMPDTAHYCTGARGGSNAI